MPDPTPAGGTRYDATWTDAHGKPCAPVDAVFGEIREYDADGLEIQRTYYDRTGDTLATPRLQELSLQDLDQKSTWDVRDVQTQQLITTFAAWAQFNLWDIEPPVDRKTYALVAGQIVLPSFQVAPPKLQQEVFDWLEANRPS